MADQDVHRRSLEISTVLMGYYYKKAVLPRAVITVLNQTGANFMLIGSHGLGGWRQNPRATHDVDILVAARHRPKAIQALLAAFPRFEAVDSKLTTRLLDRKTHRFGINVLKPNRPLFRAALKHTRVVRTEEQIYKIPTLEMALALKFASLMSTDRELADRYQDASDLMRMAKLNPEIDFDKLVELGDLIAPDTGKELLKKVRRVRAGDKVTFV